MITAALPELSDKLQAFIRDAAEDEAVILDNGRPVAVLRTLTADDHDELQLLNDPRFHSIVTESRREYTQGKFTRLEDIDN